MELLRQIEGQQRDLDEIRELTQEIHDVLLIESATVREENFTAIEHTLAHYYLIEGDASSGFASYDKVSERDRRALVGPVTVLAEELSTLRGLLGLN